MAYVDGDDVGVAIFFLCGFTCGTLVYRRIISFLVILYLHYLRGHNVIVVFFYLFLFFHIHIHIFSFLLLTPIETMIRMVGWGIKGV